ncbi:sensor histidine kinase [Ohtaekwangia koreensis]|uniref:histidine kinase n=1 Tax=Ohtaekwangia koreensis TaxID=688867 RepID=A0A1T5MDN0_9BACT|nr:HAMP domain-containing sensor histidine kinase [Ohtaekwangia koreensis]SKC86255.1 His Kinase A (phospho-acceptor) domain-containing protein [Ohtaekwangia koreensis]
MKSKLKLIVACILFLVAGLLAAYYSYQQPSPRLYAEKLSEGVAREVEAIEKEASTIIQAGVTDSAMYATTQSEYSFFLYDKGSLVYWTNNKFVPTFASVSDPFILKLLKSGNSDYLARKWAIAGQKFLVGVIPLYKRYPITNDYLSIEWNKRIFPTRNIFILEGNATVGIPVCVKDACPFKVNILNEHLLFPERAAAAVILLSIAVVLAIVLVYREARRIKYPEVGFIILYFFLLGLRTVMVGFNFPAAFVSSDLFNPQIFASSTLNASLADLVLNEAAVLLLCFYIFRHYIHGKGLLRLVHHKVWSWPISFLFAACILFAALFPFVVIQTLANNSVIVLDIAQSLKVDILRIVALIAVVMAGICSFLFSHAFIRLLVAGGSYVKIIVSFLLATVLFVVINEFTGQEYISSLVMVVLYCIVVYALKLYRSLKRLSFATFAYLFVALFFMAANGAYTLQYFAHKKKIENQFRFASNFLIDRDDFGEYLLSETASNVSQDIFIQKRITSIFLSYDAIRQKIRQVFLPAYFNKYDVDIFLFNAAGQPLDDLTSTTFSGLIARYDQEAYRTQYDNVYFINSPEEEVAQQYLVRVPIRKQGTISGHVVLQLSLKKIIPENVYPELLVDNRFKQFFREQDISYAVFSSDKVLYSSGDFNYDQLFSISLFGNPEIHTSGIAFSGYDHIAVEDENGRIAVVSSQRSSLTSKLSGFSFLMVTGLMIILVLIVVQGAVNYIRGDKLYFTARIQLLLNLSFFLPLIIVSVITLQLISRSSQNQLNEEYLRKARTIGEQISGRLSDVSEAGADYVNSFFEGQVNSLAKLDNLDINIYSPKGLLIATSQPMIEENELLSDYISSSALQRIKKGQHRFIDTEQVGKLQYFVAYTVLKSPVSGNAIGILGIPFFRSGASLERVQINIFTNILNIFALIFIALVVLAYFVSKWLTFPLEFITQSLRRTSLTKTNQPLVWKADDEIGLMVKEYNQMLYNLGESKAELEQTQRERTWREVAQQVAHEIKNPLTPMKLTLQQLERNIQSGTNATEKTAKAVSSLLTQVDTLNDIASSFSAFAKMPEPVIQPVELVSLLKRIVDLHSHSGEIILKNPIKELYVLGDEQLLGRTFSNIILNAFQAARPGEAAVVHIAVQKKDNAALISFQDNGKGIEPDVAERIFYPHFTTKKSGSGLGLAIAKQAIEQMKGRIWFETQVGKGTTFFIEILIKG